MMYQYFGYLMYFLINNSVVGILKFGIFIFGKIIFGNLKFTSLSFRIINESAFVYFGIQFFFVYNLSAFLAFGKNIF